MNRHFVSVLALIALSAGTALAQTDMRTFSKAMSLYGSGMYERARILFNESDPSGRDPQAAGYSVLCSVIMQSRGAEDMIASYDARFPSSPLAAQIHWQQGRHDFDSQDYVSALEHFSHLDTKNLKGADCAEFEYKRAYSQYMLGALADAATGMKAVLSYSRAEFDAPARYALGFISYNDEDFRTAEEYFRAASQDERFTAVAQAYILECRFLQKDYAYVVRNGDSLFEAAPAERRPHLARILSESYLVEGNADKASFYFKQAQSGNSQNLTRSDHFYAGSLSYANSDWQGAVSSFSLMPSRTDSLGQIANYQMAYSYIKLKNKVAALTAFRDASRYAFDPAIQEDAFFNYAKLAFDLNNDSSVFSEYLKNYSGSNKGDQIYSYMALASLLNHDFASAVEAYDNIDELTPEMRSNYMKANYLRANQLIGTSSWSAAIPCLKAASFYTDKRDQFNQLTRWWLAESYFRTERYDEAVKLFTELYNLSALDLRQEGRSISYSLAYCYFRMGDYDNAVKWFDTYIASADKTYRKDALERRADAFFVRKDYKTAAAAYKEVVDSYLDAGDIYPYYQLGLSYGLSGKTSDKAKVLENVKKASPADPYYAEAMYELGRSYVSLKKEKEAISTFSTLAISSQDSEVASRANLELGMLYRNRKDNDKALDYYKKVVEIQKTGDLYDDALYAIENIYQKKGDTDGYLDYLSSLGGAGKTDAEKESLYYASAEEVFTSQNYQKAISSLQNYMDRYPSGQYRAEASFYMAESHRMLGNKEKAVDLYNESLRMKDDGPFAEGALAQVAALNYGLERYALAFDAYATLLERAKIDENKDAARAGMMRSAYRAKLYQDAIAAAQQAASARNSSAALRREAEYVQAKSLLATSQREQAFEMLASLALRPDTDEGAEACYLVIQDIYDRGEFKAVQDKVYEFADKGSDQSYWLAKAFIVLGDSFMELDNPKQARATYESVAEGYSPSSSADDVLDSVKMRLEKLSEME